MRIPTWTGRLIVIACVSLLPADSALAAGSSFHVSPLLVTHDAEPGSKVTGRLRVVNDGDEPASFQVILEDFVTDAEGTDTWNPPSGHGRSMREWFSFNPSHLRIPAASEAYIHYEIEVPASGDGGAPLDGSHWVGLRVQSDRERKTFSDDAGPRRVTRVGMQVALVYAVKMYLDVAGTERPFLESVGLEAGAEPGSLTATFANRGNVMLRPRVWLELRDSGGSVLSSVEALRWTLQPHTDHHYRFALRDLPDQVPDGTYQVLVLADYGGERLQGISAPVIVESTSR